MLPCHVDRGLGHLFLVRARLLQHDDVGQICCEVLLVLEVMDDLVLLKAIFLGLVLRMFRIISNPFRIRRLMLTRILCSIWLYQNLRLSIITSRT